MSDNKRFSSVRQAARMRDVIRRIAHAAVDQKVPPDDFGTITDVDEENGMVTYTTLGSGAENRAAYGYGRPPKTGDTVRITGRTGSRWVASPDPGSDLPPGGALGAALIKMSDEDGDVDWGEAGVIGASQVEVLTATITVPAATEDTAPSSGTLSWVHTAGDVLMDLTAPAAPKFLTDGTYHLNCLTNGLNFLIEDDAIIGGAIGLGLTTTRFPDNPYLVDINGSGFDYFSLLFLSILISESPSEAISELLENYSDVFNFAWSFLADNRILTDYFAFVYSGDDVTDVVVTYKLYVVKISGPEEVEEP